MSKIVQALVTPVVVPHDDENHELEIRFDGDDVVEFYLDGKKIFGGDWSANFEPFFKKALQMWEEKL